MGIGTAAGSDPAGLPKTVNSMTPCGVVRGRLIIVSRTNRRRRRGVFVQLPMFGETGC